MGIQELQSQSEVFQLIPRLSGRFVVKPTPPLLMGSIRLFPEPSEFLGFFRITFSHFHYQHNFLYLSQVNYTIKNEFKTTQDFTGQTNYSSAQTRRFKNPLKLIGSILAQPRFSNSASVKPMSFYRTQIYFGRFSSLQNFLRLIQNRFNILVLK